MLLAMFNRNLYINRNVRSIYSMKRVHCINAIVRWRPGTVRCGVCAGARAMYTYCSLLASDAHYIVRTEPRVRPAT